MDIQDIAQIASYIITATSVITATTSTPKDDGVVAKLYKVIEFFALVNNKAKQK
jgi:hypothetical protein